MEIPLNAQVECTDGVYGRLEFVLIDPVTDQVTYLVVKADSSPNTEYNVPVEFVTETIDDTVRLSCSMAELEKMKPFIKTTFIEQQMPDYEEYRGGMYGMRPSYYMPYVVPEMTVKLPVETQQIPKGELAVNRGTRVEATDGYVGKVDEFVVNPENGNITHFVMRTGHLWGKKDVIIPISAMGETRDDTVFVKLDKNQIESLPTFPVHRRWS
jgi:sporulation protein YlmC with PRC-barrel domain